MNPWDGYLGSLLKLGQAEEGGKFILLHSAMIRNRVPRPIRVTFLTE
jgi:hypothetical protein